MFIIFVCVFIIFFQFYNVICQRGYYQTWIIASWIMVFVGVYRVTVFEHHCTRVLSYLGWDVIIIFFVFRKFDFCRIIILNGIFSVMKIVNKSNCACQCWLLSCDNFNSCSFIMQGKLLYIEVLPLLKCITRSTCA